MLSNAEMQSPALVDRIADFGHSVMPFLEWGWAVADDDGCRLLCQSANPPDRYRSPTFSRLPNHLISAARKHLSTPPAKADLHPSV